MIPKRIVGEVSKNWSNSEQRDPILLSQLFEEMIVVNSQRGYELESWQVTRVTHPLIGGEVIDVVVNETIIAVFKEIVTNE